jgi:hypothetical protein
VHVLLLAVTLRGLERFLRTGRRSQTLAALLLMVVIVAEQYHTAPASWSGDHFLAASDPALVRELHDAACDAFLYTTLPQEGAPWYGTTIDATSLAVAAQIPTINGYSGAFPPGYPIPYLVGPHSPEGRAALLSWVSRELGDTAASVQVCQVDADTVLPITLASGGGYTALAAEQAIDFSSAGNLRFFAPAGLSFSELTHTWTEGTHSEVSFSVAEELRASSDDIDVVWQGWGITPDDESFLRTAVVANGHWIGELLLTEATSSELLTIPADVVGPEGAVTLEFIASEALRPCELDRSSDCRALSISHQRLTLATR